MAKGRPKGEKPHLRPSGLTKAKGAADTAKGKPKAKPKKGKSR